MKSPVLVTALVLAALLAMCRGSSAESKGEEATQDSETAQNVAAGSVNKLGPEQEETGYCMEKGCGTPGT